MAQLRHRAMATMHFKTPPQDALPAAKVAVTRDSATGHFLVGFAKIEDLRRTGFTLEEIYRIVGPRRTLARRKEQDEKLSAVESDRALRLERIAQMADRVFGDHDKAQRWLRKPSRVLEDAPINLLQSETGAFLVEQELHRIDYGVFA